MSTSDVLTIIAETAYQVLNINGEAQAIALEISKAFDMGLSYRFSSQIESLWYFLTNF